MFDDFDLNQIFGGPLGTSLFGGGGAPPGGAPLFGNLPELPVSGGGPGLLKAGNDDFMPPALPSPGAGMLKAGGEQTGGVPTNIGASRGLVGLGGPAAPAAPAAPAPAVAGPGAVHPAVDPDRNKPFPDVRAPVIPNSGGGPDERVPAAPVPIVPPRIDVTKPTAGGGTVTGPGVAAPPAPAAAPGAATPAEEPNKSPMQKFLDEMGKVQPGQQQKLTPGNVGAVGPAYTPNTSELFAKLMAEHAAMVPKVGPVPKPFELRRGR